MSIFTATLYAVDRSAVNASLTALSITQSIDSPATALSAKFSCEHPPGEIAEVSAFKNGLPFFTGRLDRLKTSLTEKGINVTAECRSSGALLLDNEALPHVYEGADADIIFARYIAPYGFTCVNKMGKRRLSFYTVRKGMSEWEAFCGFVRRAYALEPYAEGNKIIVGKPAYGSGLTLSNTGPGIPFTALEYVFSPYEILSEIIIRSWDGYYNYKVGNHYASSRGIKRKRYEAPSSELAETAASDANSRITSSMLARDEIHATIPEILDSRPGQAASVKSGGLERYGMAIKSQTLRMDAAGCFTDLILTRSEV